MHMCAWRWGWLALVISASAMARPGTQPAPMVGLDGQNRNVSSFVSIQSNPFIRWRSQQGTASPGWGGAALVLDNRGVLFGPSMLPLLAATGQSSGLNIISNRDSTPALDDSGNSYMWSSGRLRAYSASGSLRWIGPTTNFSDGHSIKLLPDGSVLASGGDNQMMAYTSTGALKWTAPGPNSPLLPAPAIDSQGNSYIATSGGDGVVYHSFDANGNKRWTTTFGQQNLFSRPILGPDNNLYLSEYYGTRVKVVDPATGSLVRAQSNLYGGIQAIDSAGQLYSCSYQTVTCTDALGRVRWSTDIASNLFLNRLTVDSHGNVVCTTENNVVMAFSNTGASLWTLSVPDFGSETFSPVIGPDGSVYLRGTNAVVAIGGTVPGPGVAALGVLAVLTSTRTRRRMPR